MSVRLISKTVCCDESLLAANGENISSQDLIAYITRVSNPSNQENFDTSEKLLRYCMKHKHWSPFEQFFLTVEINTTRDIGRQILRHRSFSFQEFSQRYAKPTDLGFTIREARLQDKKNRQNSLITDDDELKEKWIKRQEHVQNFSAETYQWAIDNGIAKEQARAVLPEGLTNSRMYMSGSLRSFIHYCLVRADPSTQKEHREIALEVFGIIIKEFPFMKELVQPTIKQVYLPTSKEVPTAWDETLNYAYVDEAGRIKVIGHKTKLVYDGDQGIGDPYAICHACGLGYKCSTPDCDRKLPNPSYLT